MTIKSIIKIIAFIELLIGVSTVSGVMVSALLSLSKKSPNVFIFVLLSAAASTAIGIGLFNYKGWARTLLIFFSGYIILTKALIFANLLYFNGEIITFIPASFKNYVSVTYHFFIILFFTRRATKRFFTENEPRA